MSSTNRSDARQKHISDYYVTPTDCINDFFKAWFADMETYEDDFLSIAQQSQSICYLDPCAGGDANNAMSYPDFIENNILCDGQGSITSIDIREDSHAGIKGDFLQMQFTEEYDVVITNPPFNIAIDIIEKSLQVVQDGGYVIMLLRLNFFGSKARKSFWDKNMPIFAYIHHRRMSFTDDGKTDSIEYMHAVWQKGASPTHCKIRVI